MSNTVYSTRTEDEEYCEIEYCESQAAYVVTVTSTPPSQRYMCSSCEYAYAMGAQHGKAVAKAAKEVTE